MANQSQYKIHDSSESSLIRRILEAVRERNSKLIKRGSYKKGPTAPMEYWAVLEKLEEEQDDADDNKGTA